MTERNSPLSNNSIPAAHKTKAVSLPGLAGKWGSQCTCGWVSEPQYGRGARDRARSAGYDHEIDAEEAAGSVKPWHAAQPGDVWRLWKKNQPIAYEGRAEWVGDELVFVLPSGTVLELTDPLIDAGHCVYSPAGGVTL